MNLCREPKQHEGCPRTSSLPFQDHGGLKGEEWGLSPLEQPDLRDSEKDFKEEIEDQLQWPAILRRLKIFRGMP